MNTPSTSIEFTAEFSTGTCYKFLEGLPAEDNEMFDTLSNLLNVMGKEYRLEHKHGAKCMMEIWGRFCLEFRDVEHAASKRDDMAFRKEFLELFVCMMNFYVDMQRKSLRLAA